MNSRVKRQKQLLTVLGTSASKVVALGLVAALGFGSSASAKDESVGESVNENLSSGQIAVSVIATGAGVLSGKVAFQQNVISKARLGVQSAALFDGSGSQLSGLPKVTAPEFILKGTVPGDVIRIEYIAGNEATLDAAVADLKSGKETWESRVAQLKADREILNDRFVESRRAFTAAPLNEQSKAMRLSLFEEFSRNEKSLAIHDRILADADMRMHGARAQYHAANMNLGATKKTHVVAARFHIVRDILVDETAPAKLQTFFAKNLEAGQVVRGTAAIPHLRLVRIQSPHLGLASKAAGIAKAGFYGAVLAGGIAVEELIVGGIGKNLEELARTQLAPEARSESRTEAKP